MKRLPIGIQNFRKIVEGDYVYVDKTQFIYNLIGATSYNFLSRPRRFGKSLLLDTIGEVFAGNKELFKGLWIYDSDYAFQPHPILRLDMSKVSTENDESLKESIISMLMARIDEEGLSITDKNPSDMFWKFIMALHKKHGQRVVVLVDEYDKPMLDRMTNPDLAEKNRDVLRGFYGILKSMDPHLRFTMFTGVSKFTKTSVFSELNNLTDITMDEAYAGICGIPVDELELYFGQHIDNLKTLEAFEGVESIHDEILAWYDGYSWDGKSRYINPFSLLSFLNRKSFESFWYSSGSPKFLIDLIKGKPESFLALKNLKIKERMLDNFDIRSLAIEPLLFQTGYLTVKEIIRNRGSVIAQYRLDIPNSEVREAFHEQVLATLTENDVTQIGTAQIAIAEALEAGNLQRVLEMLRSLFASIPYQLHGNDEAYYHSIFIAAMTVLGFDMDAEVSTSRGRVDAVLELEDKVFVFEFKYAHCDTDASEEARRALFDRVLDDGMAQIVNRGYSTKYVGGGKAICHAAFAFLGRDQVDMRVQWVKDIQKV